MIIKRQLTPQSDALLCRSNVIPNRRFLDKIISPPHYIHCLFHEKMAQKKVDFSTNFLHSTQNHIQSQDKTMNRTSLLHGQYNHRDLKIKDSYCHRTQKKNSHLPKYS